MTVDTPEGTTVRWRDRAGRWAFGHLHKTGRTYAHVKRGGRIVRVRIEEVQTWPTSTSTNDQSERTDS